MTATIQKRKYGAKLHISWFPQLHCKCSKRGCPQRKFALQKICFTVKDDFGLAVLKHFISSQLDFARQFVPDLD